MLFSCSHYFRGPKICFPTFSKSKLHPICIYVSIFSVQIFNWVPQFYNDPSDLPESMPESLKSVIRATPENQRNQVWVSCDGLTTADRDLLNDKIEYHPSQGLPEYYYPFRNQKGYLSPLVAVRLLRPTSKFYYLIQHLKPGSNGSVCISAGQVINIECKLWAKNIHLQGGRDRSGSVLLELMIE